MENKLPSKETHVWTLSDFIERRKEWDQGDEARLAEYLQQLSNKITQGAQNTLNELDDLVASIDDTAVQIANINNEFQLLADKQFIENKVQEEDETVQTKVEKPVLREINEADTLKNNIKEALKNSFEAINAHFEKITVVVSDSDDDDDVQKHEETVLRPRIFYKKLNLPSLSDNILSDIVVDNAMSSDSDSDVEQPTNTFKDQESLSSNDVHEEDIYSISESKKTYGPNPGSADTNSIIFEPAKPKPKNVPTYAYVDAADDLFSPPPLTNDDDDENLENEYNIFGHGSSNMFGERNLWDDIDDDDNDDFSNEPPLPIYSDNPPQQETKPITQEKVEIPSIQQTLNDELRKRFQKDTTSSSSDNIKVESSKIKLPKGAVNILGGTDVKPYNSSPAQNIKESKVPEISKTMAATLQNNAVENFKKNVDTSNKLVDDIKSNPVNTPRTDSIKETKSIKKRSLFDQESDDEDLFTRKTATVIPDIKPDISKSKESSTINKKLSKNIFSESDSDEEFVDSKLKRKELVSHSIIDSNSTKLLDSSSDDDLFNIKSINNKTIPKQQSVLSSSPIQVKELINSNETKHESKPIIEENKVKEVIDELKKYSDVDIKKESLPNDNTLSSKESPNNDNITIQRNQQHSNKPQAKKFSNFFSSDEDDSDDNILFNVNEPNKNNSNKDQPISNSSKLGQNINHVLRRSKVNLFDSSSDDDIFITNKPIDNLSSSIKNQKQSSLNEIKKIGNTKQIDDCAIINEVQNAENIDKTRKDILSIKKSSICTLLSDEDDSYLSFDKNISDSSTNVSITQNINDKLQSTSLLSEEFLTPQMDQTNRDMFQNTLPNSLQNSENHESFNRKEIDIPKNEIIPNENTIQSNKSFILSSSDDEQQLISSPKIQNKDSNKETKIIFPTSNLSPGNVFNSKNQKSYKEEEINSLNTTLPISAENTIHGNTNSLFLSNDDEQQSSLKSTIKNENTIKEIKMIQSTSEVSLNDSTDGSSFSLPNSKTQTTKKLPGKLNKNAGAFINIAGLLPNSKKPSKISDSPRSVSLDENNEEKTIPTDGTKLFSAVKERARIQVKRRPQSRNARIAAARMSSIDIAPETNFQDSSRMFASTSNLDDYQSISILNDDNTDSLNKVQKTIQAPFNNKSIDDKMYENTEKMETKNEPKQKLDLFDDDSDPFEEIPQEFGKKDSHDEKKITLGEKQLESNKSLQEQLPKIESVHEKLPENKQVQENEPEIEPIKENESVNKKLPEIEPINLDDYQSISILNDDNTDSLNKVQKTIQAPFNNKSIDDKIYENTGKMDTKNEPKQKLDLFDDDSDPFEEIPQEFGKKDSHDEKKITLGEKQLESNKSLQEQLQKMEPVHEQLPENELVQEKEPEIEPIKESESVNKKHPEIEPIKRVQPEIEPTCETQMKEAEENKSKSIISNILLPKKSSSLFDDDDDDDIFSRKSGKVNKPSSNIFDSDDEFEFNHTFAKKNSNKTKSIFGDDSDDDLFNTPSKPSGSKIISQKPIDKSSQRQNRSGGDGYVKLTAESVAVNPLESKKN